MSAVPHMRLAIVGTTYVGDLNDQAKAADIINDALDRYDPTEVISGGADGIDRLAAVYARRRGIPVDEMFPTNHRWHPAGYKERNARIASTCDVLIRIHHAAAKTYGSGWTADFCEELGKPVERIRFGESPAAVTERGDTP